MAPFWIKHLLYNPGNIQWRRLAQRRFLRCPSLQILFCADGNGPIYTSLRRDHLRKLARLPLQSRLFLFVFGISTRKPFNTLSSGTKTQIQRVQSLHYFSIRVNKIFSTVYFDWWLQYIHNVGIKYRRSGGNAFKTGYYQSLRFLMYNLKNTRRFFIIF